MPSQTHSVVTTTKSVSNQNLNHRRFDLVSLMAVQITAAAKCQATEILCSGLR